MKKTFFLIAMVAVALLLAMCKQESEDQRTIITKKIQYDVPIINDDPDFDWWIKNIGGEDREALIGNIFARVLSGDVKAYDYFNAPLDKKQVKAILVDSMFMTLQRPYHPYAEYDTLVINIIRPEDVTMLRFLEEWKYDEQTLAFEKKIYAICPVIEIEMNGRTVTRPLFWIYIDPSILKNVLSAGC